MRVHGDAAAVHGLEHGLVDHRLGRAHAHRTPPAMSRETVAELGGEAQVVGDEDDA